MMKDVDPAVISELRRLGSKWVEIAVYCKVTDRALRKWRTRTHFVDPMAFDDDEAVKPILVSLLRDHPERGRRLILNDLRANHDVNIPRDRLRALTAEADPTGLDARRIALIPRIVYDGVAPGHIWHIDTHHKIGKYGFVTFGAIDGYSHELIALKCCASNTAAAILDSIANSPGLLLYGFPELIRADAGLENIAIGRMINTVNGLGHFLVGKSVHNQRIERFWGVMHNYVTRYYKNLLDSMVKSMNLILCPAFVWVLQLLLMDRINHELTQFVGTWNRHDMACPTGGRPRCPTAQHVLHPNPRYRQFQTAAQRQAFFNYVNGVSAQLALQYEGRSVARGECPFDEAGLANYLQRIELVALNDNLAVVAFKLGRALKELHTILAAAV